MLGGVDNRQIVWGGCPGAHRKVSGGAGVSFFKEDGAYLGDVRGPGIPPFELGHENVVSSMFSAIRTAVQKFAQDEFQASEHASMNEFKMDMARQC
ncbi:MAG: hypothetical protein HC782_03425 [Gammaproteobacteria bacterium]|nr:hypothetical protein [Gammaproteobacteria bacterium]